MTEHQAREYVRKLRRFYTDAFIYGIVNIGLILIWAISGGGYFWPIWVIIGWGIGLGIHAFSLGIIPQANAFMPFMSPEWENKEIQRLMKTEHKGHEKKTVAVSTEENSKKSKISPARKKAQTARTKVDKA